MHFLLPTPTPTPTPAPAGVVPCRRAVGSVGLGRTFLPEELCSALRRTKCRTGSRSIVRENSTAMADTQVTVRQITSVAVVFSARDSAAQRCDGAARRGERKLTREGDKPRKMEDFGCRIEAIAIWAHQSTLASTHPISRRFEYFLLFCRPSFLGSGLASSRIPPCVVLRKGANSVRAGNKIKNEL